MDAEKQFDLGERLALEWVITEIDELFEHNRDVLDTDVKRLAERICKRIDAIYKKAG